MLLKEKIIKEIDQLNPIELARIYDMVMILKRQHSIDKSPSSKNSYLKVRKALKSYQGSISEVIIDQRAERL